MKYFIDSKNIVFAFLADGSQDKFITSSMNPIDERLALAAANPQPTLNELKTAKWNEIKAERDNRIQHGGYQVGDKWFHSDTFSRTQQVALVVLGANIPTNTPWKTMDGSFVTMTQALAGQIFAAAALSDVAIFGVAETHRTAMEASADPASYDFSGGWPVAFGI